MTGILITNVIDSSRCYWRQMLPSFYRHSNWLPFFIICKAVSYTFWICRICQMFLTIIPILKCSSLNASHSGQWWFLIIGKLCFLSCTDSTDQITFSVINVAFSIISCQLHSINHNFIHLIVILQIYMDCTVCFIRHIISVICAEYSTCELPAINIRITRELVLLHIIISIDDLCYKLEFLIWNSTSFYITAQWINITFWTGHMHRLLTAECLVSASCHNSTTTVCTVGLIFCSLYICGKCPVRRCTFWQCFKSGIQEKI